MPMITSDSSPFAAANGRAEVFHNNGKKNPQPNAQQYQPPPPPPAPAPKLSDVESLSTQELIDFISKAKTELLDRKKKMESEIDFINKL